MNNSKSNSLNGKHNKRLDKMDEVHNEGTAAWANTDEIVSHTNVSIPSDASVIDAKNWVDNGSKL